MNNASTIRSSVLLFLLAFWVPTLVAQTLQFSAVNSPSTDLITALSVDEAGHLLAGSSAGVFRSTDQGTGWTAAVPFSASDQALYDQLTSLTVTSNGNLFANGNYRYDTGTSTWVDLGATFGVAFTGVTESDDHTLLATGKSTTDASGGLFASSDFGVTWAARGAGLPSLALNGVSRNRSNQVFVASNGDGVFRSDDVGENWEQVGLKSQEIVNIITFASDSVWAVTSGADMFRTTDGADNWSNLQYADGLVRALAIDEAGNIFLINDAGLQYSLDGGISWIKVTDLDGMGPQALTIGSDGHLYVSTANNGLLRSQSPATSVDTEAAPTTPTSFRLEGNYPNPFNPQTTIRFTLDRATALTLVVYDVLGREVARLFEGTRPAGVHEMTWQAGHAPSGLYFYRLQAGQQSSTRSMMLLR